jgi:GNAT superfamily N-acetyltransferase
LVKEANTKLFSFLIAGGKRSLEFITMNHWDEKLWNEQVSPIYHHAFDGKGAKPKKVIRNMFRKNLCYLHIGISDRQVMAMAITGKLEGTSALIIDYLAVHHKCQNRGFGMRLLEYIKDWSITKGRVKGLVIEVESIDTPETRARKGRLYLNEIHSSLQMGTRILSCHVFKDGA